MSRRHDETFLLYALMASWEVPEEHGSKHTLPLCLFLFLARVHLDLVAEMESLVPLEIPVPLALQAPLVLLALLE